MSVNNDSIQSVEEIIRRVGCYSREGRLPRDLEDEISVHSEWAIEFIKYLSHIDPKVDERSAHILYRLLEEALNQIRYKIDRKDQGGFLLLRQVQETLRAVITTLTADVRFALNNILFSAKLPLDEIDEPGAFISALETQLDITPRLPELLEQLRKEKAFKTCFELYELILPQMQLMPIVIQLSVIAEMARSKKPIAHELAVLMLLHPKHAVRKKVSVALLELSDHQLFTPVDLRRLIMIRNWVPSNERIGIDAMISWLRQHKVSPAPYPATTLSQLVSSSMDGAGVLSVIMESKKNKRQIAGFLLKIGVGVREPWVMRKAPKGYFNQLIEENKSSKLPIKPVSIAYVNKMVQHFLSESIEHCNVPEATFIEIAELFGAHHWQPQPLSFMDEVQRLQAIYKSQLSDALIERSLQRSGQWHLKKDIALSWFESGDIAEASLIESTEQHAKDSSQSLTDISTESLMNRCLYKWKTIFLVTCLWMRSKEKHTMCGDLFTVLYSLANGAPPSSIPLLCNVTTHSMASTIKREWYE